MKTCKKCNEQFEGRDCKPCKAAYMRDWNLKNPEKVKASKKKKYVAHKDHIDAKNKAWAEKNREKSNAIKKAYKERNRDSYLAQQRKAKKERYLKDRDLILSQRQTPEAQKVLKKWRQENRARLNAKSLVRYHLSEDKSKFAARQDVRYGLINGKISKPDKCQVCGSGNKLEGHHHDYQRPLEISWLCVPCHKKEHRKYFNKGGV